MKNSSNNGKLNFDGLILPEIKEDMVKVEEKISEALFAYPPLIEKIGKHIFMSGGKRIRPILHLLSARLADSHCENSINIAASVELVHMATLLHDDVIDFSLTRRGKPSANILWGNKSSILVGDYLLSKCLAMIVAGNNQKITELFSQVFEHLAVGEMLELVNEHNLQITFESYLDTITKKTSSLFKLCMEAGSLLNGKDKIFNGSLGEFGLNFGITFQLIDDYLDYFGDAEKMGKPIMGDFKEKKVTFPLISLNKLIEDKERKNLNEIFLEPDIRESEELFIKGLMEKYEINKIILDLAKNYREKAYHNLKNIKESPYKKSLLGILEYNLSRES